MKNFKGIGILWIFMAIAVCGCGIQRRSSEKQYFLLNIQRTDVPVATTSAACMRVRPCRVAAPFATRSLVYRTGTVLYEQDSYNLFLTSPDDQITDAMRMWFRQSGMTECVSPDETASEKYTLEPRVDMLCADFNDKENPVAVVQIHVLVTTFDASCSCVKTVLEKTFSAQTPLPVKPAAAQVVEGLSVSLSQILQDMENNSENVFR